MTQKFSHRSNPSSLYVRCAFLVLRSAMLLMQGYAIGMCGVYIRLDFGLMDETSILKTVYIYNGIYGAIVKCGVRQICLWARVLKLEEGHVVR